MSVFGDTLADASGRFSTDRAVDRAGGGAVAGAVSEAERVFLCGSLFVLVTILTFIGSPSRFSASGLPVAQTLLLHGPIIGNDVSARDTNDSRRDTRGAWR